MKVYISGPMTGRPEFNYPAFHAAAGKLRAAGYEVLNPAEINTPEIPYAEALRRGLRALLECDAVFYLLGWEQSAGVRVEAFVARAVGLTVYLQADQRAGSNGAYTLPGLNATD